MGQPFLASQQVLKLNGVFTPVLSLAIASGLVIGSAPSATFAATPSLPGTRLRHAPTESRGQALYQAGDYSAAIGAWQTAAQTYATQNNLLAQAQTLSNIALAQQQQGDWGGARVTLSTSWALLTGLNTPAAQRIQAQVLSHQAYLKYNLGDRAAALADWQAAMARYPATAEHPAAGDAVEQWYIQLAIAQAHHSLGQHDAALQQIIQVNQALDASSSRLSSNDSAQQELQNHNLVALKIHARRQWGDLLRHQGQLQASQQRLEEGLTFAAASLPATQATSRIQGKLWLSLGHTARAQAKGKGSAATQTQAERFYQNAAAIHETEIQARLALMALWSEQIDSQSSNNKQFTDTKQSNNTTKLKDAWTTIQNLLKTAPSHRRHLYSRIQLIYQMDRQLMAASHQTSGAPVQALETRQIPAQTSSRPLVQAEALEALAYEGIQQAYALDDVQAIAQALGALGHLYGQQERWEKAQSLTQEAIQLAESSHRLEVLYPLQGQLAHLLLAQLTTPTQGSVDNPTAKGLMFQEEEHRAAIAAYSIVLQTLEKLAAQEAGRANSTGQANPTGQPITWQSHLTTYQAILALLQKTTLPVQSIQHERLQTLTAKLKSLELQAMLRASDADIPAPSPTFPR